MSMSSKVIIPWEERPAGCKDVLWRSVANPIIPRDLLPTSNSIFNSAVVPFGDGFAGVFRCDDTNRRMRLHVGFSKDAINWNIKEEPLKFQCDDEEMLPGATAITVLLSVWPIRSISRRSTSWKTLLFLSTVTEYFSRAR